MALALERNEGGERILSEKVFGSTLKKHRQPKFVAQVAKTMRDDVLVTANGPITVAAFTTPAEEVHDCVAHMTRGLLVNFYPEFNYHGHHFMVLDFHAATFAKGDADQQLKVIREMVSKTRGDYRGHFNEFRFWRQVDLENEYGAWLLVFYEAVAFTVIHTKTPIEAVLAKNR